MSSKFRGKQPERADVPIKPPPAIRLRLVDDKEAEIRHVLSAVPRAVGTEMAIRILRAVVSGNEHYRFATEYREKLDDYWRRAFDAALIRHCRGGQ